MDIDNFCIGMICGGIIIIIMLIVMFIIAPMDAICFTEVQSYEKPHNGDIYRVTVEQVGTYNIGGN
jgi:hypothetical protein